MIIYYRDQAVEVSSTAVHVHRRRFALAELDYVWHKEVTSDPAIRRRLFGRSALNVAVLVGGVLAVLGAVYLITIALGNERRAVTEVILPLAGVVLLVGLAGPLLEVTLHRLDTSFDAGDAVHEIWAVWRGREILLLRLDDELRFGKVYRSIQRALEQHPR